MSDHGAFERKLDSLLDSAKRRRVAPCRVISEIMALGLSQESEGHQLREELLEKVTPLADECGAATLDDQDRLSLPILDACRQLHADLFAVQLERAIATLSPESSDDEGVKSRDFLEMVRLIVRYADTDMDQWDLIRVPSRFGDLYISLSRELTEDAAPATFRRLNL